MTETWPFSPLTDSTNSTKDELQALEADLQHLAISNRDLAHSNKTLTDTIAAISRAPLSSVESRTKHPLSADSAVDLRGNSKEIHVNSLIAMPPTNLPPIIRRRPVPAPQMADHLLLCMKSVQELATTITSALEALHGQEKTGSSDVHGSYAKLSANLDRLPAGVQCVHCARSVTWLRLEPIQPDLAQVGACICMCQSSPSNWKPCDSPMDEVDIKRVGFPLAGTRPFGQALERGSQCADAVLHNEGMSELNQPAAEDSSDVHPGVRIPPVSYADVPAAHPNPTGEAPQLSRRHLAAPSHLCGKITITKSPGHNASHADENPGKAELPFKWPSPPPSAIPHQDKLRMPPSKRRPVSGSSPLTKREQINISPYSEYSMVNTSGQRIQALQQRARQQQAQQQQSQQQHQRVQPQYAQPEYAPPQNAQQQQHQQARQQQQEYQQQQAQQQQQVQPQSQRVQENMDLIYGLNMDFADIPAGGGDVLDNFDFDSFLNNGGIGFELENAALHSISDQPSRTPSDTLAGALHDDTFRRMRSLSRSTKETSRSRSRSRTSSRETIRSRRNHRSRSRGRYESTAGQLGSPAAAAEVVGGLTAESQDYRWTGGQIWNVNDHDHATSSPPTRYYSKSANEHPRKRARSDAFPSYEDDYAAFVPPSMGPHVSAAPVTRKAFMRVPENDDSDEMSPRNPTALQALLDRWLDAGAAAVLLESS
jgi:hypothetical protein